jgi:hypothetical protein
MKKLVYVLLMSILALMFIEAYSTADAERVKYTQFEEQLMGTVSESVVATPDSWTATEKIITGTGDGNLPGSPIIFILTVQVRYKEDGKKSFVMGNWTIVASGTGGSISGKYQGQGTDPEQFTGTFRSYNDSATGIFSGKMVYGDFESKYLPPDSYAAQPRYEALWEGTIKETS